MKKIPVAEQNKQTPESRPAKHMPSSTALAGGREESEAEDPMAGLQADLDRFRDLALRSQADFENYKKRAAREKEEAIKYANKSLLERLVGIIDNFELGLAAAKEQSADSPIYSGLVLVQKPLSDLLDENGRQPIEPEGRAFEPNLREAVDEEPTREYPEEIVVRQTRRGYRFKDRLLRPAKVVVSSGPAK